MTASRPFPLRTGVMAAVRVEDVTPVLRRFTFRSEDLQDLGCEQPGEIITLGLPDPAGDLALPAEGWRFPPGTPPGQHWRNYTVRRSDPATGELDVDVVLHGDEGRFSAWATRAGVGSTVGYAGPRTDWVPLSDATWQLLVGDETALPAIAAVLEALPAGARALVVAQVSDPDAHPALRSSADVHVHWVHRGGAAGAPRPALAEAVAALELPEGPGQAWGAGECLEVRDVRRDLQARLGRERVKVTGYWRHRTTPEAVASF